ncbi:TonB-dependent siderophore receptor [Curvivirga sp.]|uniref:TonB-dependent siderophore receptor n=1 Tax=Curvivirga sp. TaxID=2856848 RepID=UPI003B5C3498
MNKMKYGFIGRTNKAASTILSASVLSLSVLMTVAPGSIASAQEQSTTQQAYNIPAGPLGQSLNKFASIAKITLSFTPDQVSNQTAPVLSGNYDIASGLQALLINTNLSAVYQNGAYQLETKTVAEDVSLAPINVYGRQQNDSVKEIPQSVYVISEESIEMTQSNTVGEVLRLIPNASRNGSSQDMFADNYRIRGYEAEQSTNGLGFTRTDHPTDLANVERVEVLTGPASVLYGQMEPGGTVNVVTKQPLHYFYSDAEVELGSYGSYRTTADITGPISEQVRFRFNAAVEEQGADIDNWDYSHRFFAPNVTVDLTDDTNLTVEGSYSTNGWTAINGGTPFEGAVLDNPNGDYDKSFNVASADSFTDRDSYSMNTRLTHAITDGLDIRFSHSYLKNEADWMEYFSTGLSTSDYRTVGRRIFVGEDTYNKDHDVILDLTGEAVTGSLKHKLTTGVSYRHSDVNRPTKAYNASSIDLYNPEYTETDLSSAVLLRDRVTLQEDKILSAFIQDRVTWNDFHFLAGARFIDSNQTQTTIDHLASTTTTDEVDQRDVTTQFGLVYDVTKNVSVYTSRSESFVPQQGTTAGQSPLEAEEGTQYEIGTKVNFGGIQASLAGFILNKENIAIDDPNDSNFSVAAGESRSKGIEFALSGYVMDDLFISTNYGYTRSEITKSDTVSLEGNSFAHVPTHTASIQGLYDINYVPGLRLGSTVTYTGTRFAEDANTNKLPNHYRVDVGSYYSLDDNLQLDFVIDNIFDEAIYAPAAYSGVVREAGRTYKVKLEYTF